MADVEIHLGSSPHDVISCAVRAAFINKIMFADKTVLDAVKKLLDAHCFDFTRILANLPLQSKLLTNAELLHNSIGLTPPFSRSCFIFREENSLIISMIDVIDDNLRVLVMI